MSISLSLPLLLVAITGLWVLLTAIVAHLGRSLPWSTAHWVAATSGWWGPAVLLTGVVPGAAWLYPLWVAIAVIALLHWLAAVAAARDGGAAMEEFPPDCGDDPPAGSSGGFMF